MPIDKSVRLALPQMVGLRDAQQLIRLAEKADRIESKYLNAVERAVERALEISADQLAQGLEPTPPDFEKLLMLSWFEITEAEIKEREALRSIKHLAKKKTKIPTTLKELQAIWAKYQKTKKAPKRQTAIAKKLQQTYRTTVRKWWTKRSEDFRTGKAYDQAAVKKALVEEVRMPAAQAQTVIRTETTYYQNQVRRGFYDEMPSVTHYLFVALRDNRTTNWCKTRQGMVMKKGTEFCDEQSPPIHWSCRSEITPLDPDNPNHKKMIEDPSRNPSHRILEPLPKAFKKT